MATGPFDTSLLRRRYARLSVRGRGAMPDFLHRHALEEIAARLSATRREFETALLCSMAPADAEEIVRAAGNVGEILHVAPWAVPRGGSQRIAIDPAAPPFVRGRFDLAIWLMEPALVNALPEALLAWRRLLAPGGLFLAAFPGGESLRELRAAWALADAEADGEPALRVAPFCDVKQMGGLMQLAGFAEPVADVERLRLRYADALAFMREIKALGWSAPLRARPRRPVGRHRLARAAAALEAAHAEADGRISVTLELLYLSGWASEINARARCRAIPES